MARSIAHRILHRRPPGRCQGRRDRNLGDSFPGLYWRGKAGYHLGRVMLHAVRRADETEEVAETTRDIDMSPIMARATAKQLQMCAVMGLCERFSEGLPDE